MTTARVNLTFRTNASPVSRLRAAVAALQARGFRRVGMAGAIELGMILAAQRLEAAHNDGERFDLDHEPLQHGRRPR